MQRCQGAPNWLKATGDIHTPRELHTVPGVNGWTLCIVPDLPGLQTPLSRTCSRRCCYIWLGYELLRWTSRKSSSPAVKVTQLRLMCVAPDDPALLKNLSSTRGILKRQSDMYSCIEDPFFIVILGLFPSLDTFQQFLACPRASGVFGS